MFRNPEHQFSANIYYHGVRHTVYGYAQAGNTPIARDFLSDYYGTVYLRGRLFNVYGNRDRGLPSRGQSLIVPPVSDLFPPRAGDLPSAVRMRFGSPPRHIDTASSSRRPVRSSYRRLRVLQWERVSPSAVRHSPPFVLPSQNDLPIVVENRDPNTDVALVRGPGGIMQVGRPAPLPRPRPRPRPRPLPLPLPLPLGTVTERGRPDPSATVSDPEAEPEPEAEGVLRAIGRRLWSVAEDYNPFKRRTE